MRNWKKRFLALALSAVMTMGLLPGTAYAAVGELVGNSPRQNEALKFLRAPPLCGGVSLIWKEGFRCLILSFLLTFDGWEILAVSHI